MPSKHLKKLLHDIKPRDIFAFVLGAALVCAILALLTIIHTVQTPLKPEADHVTSPWVPATVRKWDPYINEMAKKYDMDPNLIAIIITMESGGYSKAQSEADAQGLMQITPPTGQDIASKFLKKPVSKYDLLDPKTNIEFGTAYLAWLRDEFGTPEQGPSWNSTVELIAAGYNGGAGAANRVEQGKGLTDVQTVVYARDAFNMWRERHSKTSPTFDRWKERGGGDLIAKAQAELQ